MRSGAVIHDAAEVHPDCEVGAGTRIWQFASVIRRSKIGKHCSIASCVLVDRAVVGDRCVVGHGAAIEPGTVIRDDAFVGPGAVFCNDQWPRASKEDFDMELLLSGEVRSIVVGEGASVGARAVVMPGVVIGPRAMVAAGAVVRTTVPPDYLLRRDGSLERIDAARLPRRVQLAYTPTVVVAE